MAQQWKKNSKNSKGYMSRDYVTCAPEMCTTWLKKLKWDIGEDAPPSFHPPTISSCPPSLHHFLSASQRTSDAGVCERAQSMEHNPSTKVFQTGCETFLPRQTRQQDETLKMDNKDAREFTWKIRNTWSLVDICTRLNVGEGDLTVPQASYPENPASLWPRLPLTHD